MYLNFHKKCFTEWHMITNIKSNHIALLEAILISGRKLIYGKGEKKG